MTKLLGTILLWSAAVVIAFGLVMRLRRGRPANLRGRLSPRLLRMVVTVLVVVFGVGLERARAADDEGGAKPGAGAAGDDPKHATAGEPLPDAVDIEMIAAWRRWSSSMTPRLDRLRDLLDRLESLAPAGVTAEDRESVRHLVPEAAGKLVAADLEAVVAGAPLPRHAAEALVAALDALEERGCFDRGLHGYLFRAAARADGTREARAGLFARLHRHARLIDALAKARFNVKAADWNPRAWMSKAGPRPEERRREQEIVEKLFDELRRVYPTTDAGTWQSDATVEMVLASKSAPLTVERAGGRIVRAGGQPVRIGRLDVLVTLPGDACVELEHAWLPKVTLPADRMLSVFDLPATLDDAARAKLAEAAKAALAGDETEALWLERTLPFSHEAVREALAAQPDAPGAPRLRTILTLFDERLVR